MRRDPASGASSSFWVRVHHRHSQPREFPIGLRQVPTVAVRRGVLVRPVGDGPLHTSCPGPTASGMVKANTALAAPHDLKTLECAGDQATLWWVLPALWHRDVAHYSLQVCSDAACTNIVATHQVTWNWGQFDVPSLSPNTTYYFRMKSIDKNGWLDSDWSETVSCTMAKQPLPAITGFTVGNNGGDSEGMPLIWDGITHTAFDKYRLEVCSGDCSTSVGYDVTETFIYPCLRIEQYVSLPGAGQSGDNIRLFGWSLVWARVCLDTRIVGLWNTGANQLRLAPVFVNRRPTGSAAISVSWHRRDGGPSMSRHFCFPWPWRELGTSAIQSRVVPELHFRSLLR